ncbi:MAG TPA: type II toxin-antitoxin system prevent-host-death family antitoxin [Thermoanaerobaculia bacterium]|nr:type II toxin-antitoxin system prevent-host-death family antitoxin [Thermoanaerobaculia bacterium]
MVATLIEAIDVIVLGMAERVSTLEIREKLGDYLNRVALRHDQFIIERKGKPLAALVPISKLRAIEDEAARELLALLRKSGSPGSSEEEADRLANEARKAVRKQRPARR